MRSGKYYQGIRVNGRKQDYHRYIMEQHLGRKLRDTEVVHHINGDIQDNRIENLMVMKRTAHSRLHRKGQGLSEETRQKLSEVNKGKPHYYCRKLTYDQIQQIFARRQEGFTLRSIAWQFNTDHTTIMNILSGKIYKDWIPKSTS